MQKRISVIIPNYNGGTTIGRCLEAVFSSRHRNFEVIVVDDGSEDNSLEIIRAFPCTLVELGRRSGAAAARNAGARKSSGEVFFFIDADCIVLEDTLLVVDDTIRGREDTVFGGTYTKRAYDDSFFSTFQSVFIHYSETKRREPDYVASHAMAISREAFERSGGFPEEFMPILEDVEFSHRLRRSGVRLAMNPEILVRHIFGFTFLKSLRNAYRKSKYWVMYSMGNRDLLADSGTASVELKTDVVSLFLVALTGALAMGSGEPVLLLIAAVIIVLNIFINRSFIAALYGTKGFLFTLSSVFYYMLVYPTAVGAGSFAGMLTYYLVAHTRVKR